MTGHLSLSEAMECYGISEKTVRRWIKSGKLKAEKVDGRWQIFDDGQRDRTPGHDDREDDRTSDQNPLVEHLRSENERLWDQLRRRDEQIDHLTQLCAMTQKSLALAQERLQLVEEMRSRRWWHALRFWR